MEVKTRVNPGLTKDELLELKDSFEKLKKVFARYDSDIAAVVANYGATVMQFIVIDRNKTKFNEFMIDKLMITLGEEFGTDAIQIMSDSSGAGDIEIHIPPKNRKYITFNQCIEAAKSQGIDKLSIPIGLTPSGKLEFCGVEDNNRLLVGGGVGSGKTMLLHGIINYLARENTPDELKFVIFDKRQNLSSYNDLNHLLFHGTIYDDYGAYEVFKWIKAESDWRKTLFEREGCRKLSEYNEFQKISGESGLPRIVIIIDELGDWANGDINKALKETFLIKSLSSCGFFFVISTNNPSHQTLSVELAELFSARIAFKVDTMTESRILINRSRAVNLLGNGDMLYLKNGTRGVNRLQAPLIGPEDIDETLALCAKE